MDNMNIKTYKILIIKYKNTYFFEKSPIFTAITQALEYGEFGSSPKTDHGLNVCVDRITMKNISSYQRDTMRKVASAPWSLVQDESPFES